MRVGLVGTGRWAVQIHGASSSSHPHARLAAVWGRDPDRTARAAGDLGCDAAGSFDELVERCDVLTFAVPPQVQSWLAPLAAAEGRRLLLEKPLALDTGSGQELVRAIGTTPSAVFLTRRWEPRTTAWLKDLAGSDGWTSGRACFVNALTGEALDASPWRREWRALWDVGPHALSVLEAVLGDVEHVQAAPGPGDLVLLLLRHRNGSVSTAELALTAPATAARTEVSFSGATGMSSPVPQLGLQEVLAAHRAALTAVVTGSGDGPDAAYGLHLTGLLERGQRALAESLPP